MALCVYLKLPLHTMSRVHVCPSKIEIRFHTLCKELNFKRQTERHFRQNPISIELYFQMYIYSFIIYSKRNVEMHVMTTKWRKTEGGLYILCTTKKWAVYTLNIIFQ